MKLINIIFLITKRRLDLLNKNLEKEQNKKYKNINRK